MNTKVLKKPSKTRNSFQNLTFLSQSLQKFVKKPLKIKNSPENPSNKTKKQAIFGRFSLPVLTKNNPKTEGTKSISISKGAPLSFFRSSPFSLFEKCFLSVSSLFLSTLAFSCPFVLVEKRERWGGLPAAFCDQRPSGLCGRRVGLGINM